MDNIVNIDEYKPHEIAEVLYESLDLNKVNGLLNGNALNVVKLVVLYIQDNHYNNILFLPRSIDSILQIWYSIYKRKEVHYIED